MITDLQIYNNIAHGEGLQVVKCNSQSRCGVAPVTGTPLWRGNYIRILQAFCWGWELRQLLLVRKFTQNLHTHNQSTCEFNWGSSVQNEGLSLEVCQWPVLNCITANCKIVDRFIQTTHVRPLPDIYPEMDLNSREIVNTLPSWQLIGV